MADILDLLTGEMPFVQVRDCSICGVSLGYHMPFVDDCAVFFSTACGCSSASGHGRPLPPGELSDLVKAALEARK